MAPLADGRVASASFMGDLLDALKLTAPFLAFLTKAVDLAF